MVMTRLSAESEWSKIRSEAERIHWNVVAYDSFHCQNSRTSLEDEHEKLMNMKIHVG